MIVDDMTLRDALRRFERRDIQRSKWVNNPMHTWASGGLTVLVLACLTVAQVLPSIVAAPFAVDELIAFIAIGILSHSLGVLGHECYHNSFFRTPKANRILGAWLFHYPLLGRFHQLKELHLRHHRYFGTDQDPDIDHWGWRRGDFRHLVHIIKLLFGIQFIANILRVMKSPFVTPGPAETSTPAERGGREVMRLGFLHAKSG
jgi:fatty acid desaturase